jgi:hypothetical protein
MEENDKFIFALEVFIAIVSFSSRKPGEISISPFPLIGIEEIIQQKETDIRVKSLTKIRDVA